MQMKIRYWYLKPNLNWREIDVGQNMRFKLQQAGIRCVSVTWITVAI
jgi:hypothetical protein